MSCLCHGWSRRLRPLAGWAAYTIALFAIALFGASAPPEAAAAGPIIGADTTAGAIATIVGLNPTACLAPAGARSWTAIVMFAQNGNSEVSFANFSVGSDGTWGGQFSCQQSSVVAAIVLYLSLTLGVSCQKRPVCQ